MKKIAVQNLAMIVTGACNLDCKHCLRGKKCNIKMSEEVISATLNQIVSIGNLCICGGEPLLALDVIEKIFNYIIENKILVDKVTIVINGTIYSDTFLHMLKEIDRYIGNVCKKSVFFRISYDKYHMEEIKKLNLEREYIENYKKYRESKYFEGLQILDPTLKLYREGNAIFLDDSLTVPLRQIGFAITYVGKGNRFDKENGLCNIGPLVTINPNGIITECDASFYNQKIFYNYGNVVKDSIEEELLKRGEIVRPSIWYRKTGQMIKKHNTYNK